MGFRTLLRISILLMLSSHFVNCVPSDNILDDESGLASEIVLNTSPSSLGMKRDDEARLVISGGVPPYQAAVSDDSLGTVFLEPGANIISVFSKPNFTGNFSVTVTDQEGTQLFVNVDVRNGFQVFPTSRQAYAGRKIQITPLEGDIGAYKFNLIQGADQATISETGLLSINNDAPDNTAIAIEVQNPSTGETENSFIYVRDRLDSENITMAVGSSTTCIAKTNESDSERNLQCWGDKSFGKLGHIGGLVEARSAVLVQAVQNTNIVESLATQFPKNISLSNGFGCATFYNGFRPEDNNPKNALTAKCWGANAGSPNSDSGRYPGTMGSNLISYTFTRDNNQPFYIKSLKRGLNFTCALLSINEDASLPISSSVAESEDGEIRCWGHGGGEDFSRPVDSRLGFIEGVLGTNADISRNLASIVAKESNFPEFTYTVGSENYRVFKFPLYVHSVPTNFVLSPDLVTGDVAASQYIDNPTVVTKIRGQKLAVGQRHACVLKAENSNQVTCWGNNEYKQTSSAPATSYGGNIVYSQVNAGIVDEQVNRITPTNTTFTLPALAGQAVNIFAGKHHTCVISSDRTKLYCWGRNSYGQSDPNATSTANIPPSSSLNPIEFTDSVGTPLYILAGVASANNTCAVVSASPTDTSGRVYCVGNNNYGQLGLGTFYTTNSLTTPASENRAQPLPGQYVDLGNRNLATGGSEPQEVVKIVSSDDSFCVMLKKTIGASGHNLKCWGRNDLNQLGYGDTVLRAKASDSDGFILSNNLVLDVSMSLDGGTCALNANGTTTCWGLNDGGLLGHENYLSGHENPDDPLTNIPYTDLNTFGFEISNIFANGGRTCALLKSGTTHCWGNDSNGGLGNGSSYGNVGVTSNSFGAASEISGVSKNFTSIAQTSGAACAIDTEKKIRCWGSSANGITVNEVNASHVFSKAENTPSLFQFDGRNAEKISGGGSHVCSLLQNNSTLAQEVICWGSNSSGQLGVTTNSPYIGKVETASTNPSPTPFITHIQTPVDLKLGAGDTVLDIVTGGNHSCILVKTSDTYEENYVRCWGAVNNLGSIDPVILADPSDKRWAGSNFVANKVDFGGENPVQIVSGNDQTCVLFDTERVKCWGSNNSGQLGWNATSLNIPIAQIGVGYVNLGQGRLATKLFSSSSADHTCAVLESDSDADGRYDIKCWGANSRGQLGLGSELNSDLESYNLLRRPEGLLKYRID